MAIMSIAGTEQRDEDRSIVMVEITDETRESGMKRVETHRAWEFYCDGCEAFDTELSHDEAVEQMEKHRCPDLPPCAGEWEGATS